MRYVELWAMIILFSLTSCMSNFMRPAIQHKVDIMDYSSFYIVEQSFDKDTCICPTHILDIVKYQIAVQLIDNGLRNSVSSDNDKIIKINIGITKPIEINYTDKLSFAYPSFYVDRYDYLNYYYYTSKYLADISVPDKIVIDFVDAKTNKLIISIVTSKIKYGNQYLPDNVIAKYILSAMKNYL